MVLYNVSQKAQSKYCKRLFPQDVVLDRIWFYDGFMELDHLSCSRWENRSGSEAEPIAASNAMVLLIFLTFLGSCLACSMFELKTGIPEAPKAPMRWDTKWGMKLCDSLVSSMHHFLVIFHACWGCSNPPLIHLTKDLSGAVITSPRNALAFFLQPWWSDCCWGCGPYLGVHRHGPHHQLGGLCCSTEIRTEVDGGNQQQQCHRKNHHFQIWIFSLWHLESGCWWDEWEGVGSCRTDLVPVSILHSAFVWSFLFKRTDTILRLAWLWPPEFTCFWQCSRPESKEYQKCDPSSSEYTTIHTAVLGNWILSSFSTVDEVIGNISSGKFCISNPHQWSKPTNTHWSIVDAAGKSLVLELLCSTCWWLSSVVVGWSLLVGCCWLVVVGCLLLIGWLFVGCFLVVVVVVVVVVLLLSSWSWLSEVGKNICKT